MFPPKARRNGLFEEPISGPKANPLCKRERIEAILFYLCVALSTLGWWLLLWLVPSSRAIFLGKDFAQNWLWILLIPDALTALLGGTLLAFLIYRKSPLAAPLAWVHFGAQGYAWTISIALACYDPSAYWGLVSMTFATGLALAFAIRIQDINILWGPFQFHFAKEASSSEYFRNSLKQTALMWLVFLVIMPLGIHAAERFMDWRTGWTPGVLEWTVATMVFVTGAFIGLLGAWAMTRTGGGTPLPAACARHLVTSGSYKFVRNPMALGGIGQGIAVGIALGSPLVIVYAVIGGCWWELLARNGEERFLLQTFGKQYEEYRDQIRCWLPVLKRK